MIDFHPFFVHFPIALFVTAGLMELLIWLFPSLPKQNTLLLFIVASLFSIPAAVTGNSAELIASNFEGIYPTLNNHRIAANFITFFGIGFSFFLIFMKLKFPNKSILTLQRVILLLMSVAVIYTGYLGSTLVQKFGAGTKPGIEKIQ